MAWLEEQQQQQQHVYQKTVITSWNVRTCSGKNKKIKRLQGAHFPCALHGFGPIPVVKRCGNGGKTQCQGFMINTILHDDWLMQASQTGPKVSDKLGCLKILQFYQVSAFLAHHWCAKCPCSKGGHGIPRDLTRRLGAWNARIFLAQLGAMESCKCCRSEMLYIKCFTSRSLQVCNKKSLHQLNKGGLLDCFTCTSTLGHALLPNMGEPMETEPA